MRELIEEILALQPHWASGNTPEMQRRGQLVRSDLPAALSQWMPELKRALGSTGDDLQIEGRDGTGRKSQVPWVRFFSASRSPSAQSGWYVVFLFHAAGEGAYVWLGHGSTKLEGGTYVARDEDEVAAQLNWARGVLRDRIASNPRLLPNIALGSDKALPLAYEKSALVGLWYPANEVPPDETIASDCAVMAELLAVLYNAGDLGRQPFAPHPDVAALESVTRLIASGGRPRGQGFGLTHKERQAVEKHAMRIARELLEKEGFLVEDVSATQSVDYIARRGSEVVFVEVKGTTGPPTSILLTANEVALHEERYPNNALIIVHSIELDRGGRPTAREGYVVHLTPWSIRREGLRPLAYQYAVQEILPGAG